MVHVECPWCAGTATVDVADGDEFQCGDCGIRAEMAADATTELSRAA
jgi:hypothetical protein